MDIMDERSMPDISRMSCASTLLSGMSRRLIHVEVIREIDRVLVRWWCDGDVQKWGTGA